MTFGVEGPIVDVRIGIGAEQSEALAARGRVVPPPFSVSGLVDTGAQVTAIRRSIIDRMGIPSIGFMEASSSVLGGEAREVPIYPVRKTYGPLGESDPPRWRPIVAVGVDVISPGASVPIGRDLLATCRFTYDGRKRRLLMSY